MLWAEVGCVAYDGIFFSVNWILVNALFYSSCTFVNVLSCFHVCIYCKNTLLCGGNKEHLSRDEGQRLADVDAMLRRIRESPPQFQNRTMARVSIRSIMRSTMYQKAPFCSPEMAQ